MSERGEEGNFLAEEDVNQRRRMWSRTWGDDLWGLNERQRMTGHVLSNSYDPSIGRRSECILEFALLFWGPCWLFVYGQFSKLTDLFFRAVSLDQSLHPTVLHFLICNPDSHSPVGFECQRGNPAWRLFWYCWTVSWKTFLLSDQGCSGFRAIGSSAETPHLITAVKLFEELKMCCVPSFIVWGWKDSIQEEIVAI